MNVDLEAYRYAKAIAQVTTGNRGPVIAALQHACEQLGTDQMERLFSHPLVSTADKAAALSELVGPSVPAAVRGVLDLAVKQGMERHLCRITEQLRRLNYAAQGVCRVEVTSARQLGPEQVERLRAALERALGSTAEMTITVDEGLIAGVRLRMDDTVMENTVRMQLEKIGSALSGAYEG